MKIIKLYNTWEKAKDIFVKPSLKVYFGKWRNDPNLPVWRRGPIIYICGRKNLFKYTHEVKDTVLIYTGTKKFKYGDKEIESKCYSNVPKHKLPKKLKCGETVWNSVIRRKLKKWHLNWIPPMICLPTWLRFHIINLDLGWKTKYDDCRYEFPPQFSIIAFSLSLTFTLHSPLQNDFCCDDHYWECILNYLYRNKLDSLKEVIEDTGIWNSWGKDKNSVSYFAVRPEYITKEYLKEYYKATEEIKKKIKKVIL